MKSTSNYYRNTPVGQQINVFLKDRAALRRSIPLFPASLRELFGRSRDKASGKKDSGDSNDGASCRVVHA